ncbi:hypothetical protein V1504DRAFT_442521 [Lipomyces starkeyi]
MYHSHLIVALIACIACTLADTSPAASTTYPLPSILTPARATDPQFSQSPLQHSSFSVNSTVEYGKMEDPSNLYILYRDGGGSCPITNRTLWFFCDTLAYRETDGTCVGAASNSVSLATNFSLPNILMDASCTPATGFNPAIPFTSAEAALAGHPSIVKFTSTSTYYTKGNTMAQYSLNTTSNNFTVTRASQITFAPPTYMYGTFANVVVDGVAYLYGLDISSQTWNSTMPVPTQREQSAAVIQNSIPFSTGTIFFSEYHNAFLLVFFDNYADSKYQVLSAPSPVGPWATTNTVIWALTPGPGGFSYGGLAHSFYYTNDGSAGKSLMLHYSYRNTSATYAVANKLTFN